jgi:ferredoxin
VFPTGSTQFLFRSRDVIGRSPRGTAPAGQLTPNSQYGNVYHIFCQSLHGPDVVLTSSVDIVRSGGLAVKIMIDSTVCAGHGRCQAVAPRLFALDDEGYSQVIRPPTPADADDARNAALSCPEGAISLAPEGTEAT